MSTILEDKDLPEWHKALPPFPDEWGWKLGYRRRQNGRIFQHIVHDKDRSREFGYHSMPVDRVRWFFDRGVYGVVEPGNTNADGGRAFYGLALYQVVRVEETPEFVFHVTLRKNLDRIRRDGVLTGRRAEERTSGWEQAIDFVHVWSTWEQATRWTNNGKLNEATRGPWSIVTIAPGSALYDDPKSDAGGWIFECDYCVPISCITDAADI